MASTLTARTRPHCRFVFLRSKVCSPLPSAWPRGLRPTTSTLRFPTVTSIGPGEYLATHKKQPMLGTLARASWPAASTSGSTSPTLVRLTPVRSRPTLQMGRLPGCRRAEGKTRCANPKDRFHHEAPEGGVRGRAWLQGDLRRVDRGGLPGHRSRTFGDRGRTVARSKKPVKWPATPSAATCEACAKRKFSPVGVCT